MKLPMILPGLFLLILVGCAYDQLDTEPDCTGAIPVEVRSVTPSVCGQASGSIQLGISDPSIAPGSLQFSLNGGPAVSDTIFTNLTAGQYQISATDGICSLELNAEVKNEDGLNASLEVQPSSCSAPTGSITISVEGGQGTVRYALENGTPRTNPVFSSLSPGNYLVTVSDDSGCAVELEATLRSDVDFSEVENIVQNNCALSGCHGGSVSPDFREKGNILNRAGRIRARTSARSMPPPGSGISLSEEQIQAIECWVNDGAPN